MSSIDSVLLTAEPSIDYRRQLWISVAGSVAQAENCVDKKAPGDWANVVLAAFDAAFPEPVAKREPRGLPKGWRVTVAKSAATEEIVLVLHAPDGSHTSLSPRLMSTGTVRLMRSLGAAVEDNEPWRCGL